MAAQQLQILDQLRQRSQKLLMHIAAREEMIVVSHLKAVGCELMTVRELAGTS